MKNLISYCILTCCLLVHSSCTSIKTPSSQSTFHLQRPGYLEADLAKTPWNLTSINGVILDTNRVTELPYIKFIPTEKLIRGNAGCNIFFSTYDLTPDTTLTIGEVNTTKRLCRDMSVENMIISTLNSDFGFRLAGDLIFFSHPAKDITLQFKRAANQ